jgi:hypothetical protein
MWGDGFYVSDASNVTFCGVTRNRRQGLSVIEADGLVVLNSVFQNTGGTRPGAGIDFLRQKRRRQAGSTPTPTPSRSWFIRIDCEGGTDMRLEVTR